MLSNIFGEHPVFFSSSSSFFFCVNYIHVKSIAFFLDTDWEVLKVSSVAYIVCFL